MKILALSVFVVASMGLIGCDQKLESKGYATCLITYGDDSGDIVSEVYNNGDVTFVLVAGKHLNSSDNPDYYSANDKLYKDANDFIVQETIAYTNNIHGTTAKCKILRNLNK